MRKNETYEVLAVETFCFAAVCAVSVFFKKLAPNTAFVFGAPIRAVWLRAVAAAVLFAAFAVSIKLIADREHGKNSRKTAMTAAKIFFPATALIACVNAVMCIAENGFSQSVMPTVAAIISVVGHAVSLALIIKERRGEVYFCRHDVLVDVNGAQLLRRLRTKNHLRKKEIPHVLFASSFAFPGGEIPDKGRNMGVVRAADTDVCRICAHAHVLRRSGGKPKACERGIKNKSDRMKEAKE